MASTRPVIEVYADIAGSYRWRMKARNGKIIADSAEGYASRRNALRATQAFLELVYADRYVDVVDI